MATYLSVFQMMPRQRHQTFGITGSNDVPDIYDPETWDKLGLGLMHPGRDAALRNLMPDQPDASARRQKACEHLTRALDYTQAFHRAIDRPIRIPTGLQSLLVIGSGRPTPSRLEYGLVSRQVTVASQGAVMSRYWGERLPRSTSRRRSGAIPPAVRRCFDTTGRAS
jgi:hypothetical protein